MPRLRLALALAIFLVIPNPALGARLFGLVDTGELYVSNDSGFAWSIKATLPVSDAIALAAGINASDLYLATQSGSIYHSTNAGTSWVAVGAVTASDVVSMTILPSGTILVLTKSGTLYSSTDWGVSFMGLAALTGSDWVSLTRGPLGRLYALTRTGQIAESQNSGTTWTTVSAITVSNTVAIRRRNTELFVLSETGDLYRSINYGGTWTAVAALTSSSMSGLTESGSMLLAATREGEVALSSNGTSWTWVGAINQFHVTALGVDTPYATGIEEDRSPPRLVLGASPNPSRAASVFSFSISEGGVGRLEAYDVQGHLRAIRPLGTLAPGSASVRWDPAIANGSYFIRLVIDGRSTRASAKWTVVR